MEDQNFLGEATYCPEDNKLRFYPNERLSTEDYATIKKAGFKWAPKQELFVKPRWTPGAEKLMLEWCGSIEDEDKTPEERSADRAERFALYREKRTSEACRYADAYESTSPVHGYQSAVKAQRAANKHDRQRIKAYTQWDKAEYWQQRTAGVISHAIYKANPGVRRTRILRIEAEQRKHEKDVEKASARYAAWEKVRDEQDTEKAFKMAYHVANYGGGCDYSFKHPRQDKTSSLYYLMTDEADPITGHEAANLYLNKYVAPNKEGGNFWAWSKHYELRLAYEKQMLESEGGTVADVEMVPGGFVGKHQIQKVNRSPITKKVVSVVLLAPKPWHNGTEPAPLTPQSFNIQRLGTDAYRAPTDEELAEFNKKQDEKKTIKKAVNATAPKLINPTKESAQRLQDVWNAKAEKHYNEYIERNGYKGLPSTKPYEPTPIREMTQEIYAVKSKGSFAKAKTVFIDAEGKTKRAGYNAPEIIPVCKVRKIYSSISGFSHQADAVIVIIDKPQKELPEFKAVSQVNALDQVSA